MWSLEDEDSIPTRQERMLAIVSIDGLKKGLARAQINVDRLKNEISKTTTWIAPIRRLPADVLSLVFIEVCSFNWKAPLKLGAVCRRWRNTLIDTPRAWAFLQIHPTMKLFSYRLVELWIARCGAIPLHISLNYLTSPWLVASVCRQSKAIECLSFFNSAKELRGNFPQLKELRLGPVDRYLNGRKRGRLTPARQKEITLSDGMTGYGDTEKKTCILDVTRFSKLINLHLHAPSFLTMERIAPKHSFPPLQELHIHALGPHWLESVENCAETLIVLAIETRLTVFDQVPKEKFTSSIALPRLLSLSYILGDSPGFLHGDKPNFGTPVLRSYYQNGRRQAPLHTDITSVTDFFLYGYMRIDWPILTSVTHMRLQSTPYTMGGWARELEAASACPNLCSVEFIQRLGRDNPNPGFIEPLFQKRSVVTKKPIAFKYDEAYHTRPEISAVCYTFCACISKYQTSLDPYDEGCKSEEEVTDPDSENLHYYSDSDCFSESNHHLENSDDDDDGFF